MGDKPLDGSFIFTRSSRKVAPWQLGITPKSIGIANEKDVDHGSTAAKNNAGARNSPACEAFCNATSDWRSKILHVPYRGAHIHEISVAQGHKNEYKYKIRRGQNTARPWPTFLAKRQEDGATLYCHSLAYDANEMYSRRDFFILGSRTNTATTSTRARYQCASSYIYSSSSELRKVERSLRWLLFLYMKRLTPLEGVGRNFNESFSSLPLLSLSLF